MCKTLQEVQEIKEEILTRVRFLVELGIPVNGGLRWWGMVPLSSRFGRGHHWVLYPGDLRLGWCFTHQQRLFDKFLLRAQLLL